MSHITSKLIFKMREVKTHRLLSAFIFQKKNHPAEMEKNTNSHFFTVEHHLY